jgi:ParB family transcriptional regulator, chromosome partitioning protein
MPRANLKPMPEPQRDPLFGTSADLKEIVELPLNIIQLDPNQPRQAVDEKKLEELATSIREHGLLQPITVRRHPHGEGYIVVAGERRFRAHQLLGRERVEAIITKVDEKRAYEVALIENLQREDLTPFEEAAGYARLMEEYGYTQEEVAEKVGKARTTVTSTLALNRLPERIRAEGATSDKASKSLLIEVARLGSEEEQLAFWEQVKSGDTVRGARERKQGKMPEAAEVRAERSEVAKTLSFGRSFARRVERISDEYLATNQADYAALLRLAEQITGRIKAARGRIGEPTGVPEQEAASA